MRIWGYDICVLLYTYLGVLSWIIDLPLTEATADGSESGSPGAESRNVDRSPLVAAKCFRLTLRALIIKEKLSTSNRETVEQIRENPDLFLEVPLTSNVNERCAFTL